MAENDPNPNRARSELVGLAVSGYDFGLTLAASKDSSQCASCSDAGKLIFYPIEPMYIMAEDNLKHRRMFFTDFGEFHTERTQGDFFFVQKKARSK